MWLYAYHFRIKRTIHADVDGLIGSRVLVNWSKRTLFNISLWRSLTSIYSLGESSEHIAAVHDLERSGIRTRCGVYEYEGHWAFVMFGSTSPSGSPLEE